MRPPATGMPPLRAPVHEDPAAWRSATNLLCVRLDAMGDVLMTGPAMRALRAQRGDRRLTLLTSPAGAAVAEMLDEVDEVIVYDAPWMKASGERAERATDLEMVDRLVNARFDAAAIFTVYSQSPLPAAMLCHLGGIPLRAAHARENPYQLLTDWLPDPDAQPGATIRHEVRRQLDLVESLGATTDDDRLRVTLTSDALAAARGALAAAGVDPADRRWLLLHPGASAASRRYPPEMFAEAGSSLMREHGRRVVLLGGPGDAELVAQVASAMTCKPSLLEPDLDLSTTAALISLAPLLVANNSGPAHLAAAAGTPVVVLYALTNPQHAPWRVRSRVLFHDVACRNCLRSVCPMGHHLCLRGVPPAAVVEAVLDLDGEPPHRAVPVIPSLSREGATPRIAGAPLAELPRR